MAWGGVCVVGRERERREDGETGTEVLVEEEEGWACVRRWVRPTPLWKRRPFVP